jgi:hypothetical protein
VARHIAGALPVEHTIRYCTYLMEKGTELADKTTGKVTVIYDRTDFSE